MGSLTRRQEHFHNVFVYHYNVHFEQLTSLSIILRETEKNEEKQKNILATLILQIQWLKNKLENVKKKCQQHQSLVFSMLFVLYFKIKKSVTEYYEQLHTNKLHNLNEQIPPNTQSTKTGP